MNRVVSSCLLSIATLVISSPPALAQPPGNGNALPGAVAALTARVAALEARLDALQTTDAADVPGTYEWVEFGFELDSGVPPHVSPGTTDAVFTLRADGTGLATFTGGRCALIGTAAHCEPPEDSAGQSPFTWSLTAGTITLLFPDNDSLQWKLTSTGTFVFSQSKEFQPGHTFSSIDIIVKIANP